MIALVASFFGLDEDIQDLIVEELMAFLPMLTDPITSGMPSPKRQRSPSPSSEPPSSAKPRPWTVTRVPPWRGPACGYTRDTTSAEPL